MTVGKERTWVPKSPVDCWKKMAWSPTKCYWNGC